MFTRRRFVGLGLGLGASAAGWCMADEQLAGIACRSVHLGYSGIPANAFYCEATPRKSATGTYFMVCGWNTGYFGFQQTNQDKKLVLFSVWDPGAGDDPSKVPTADRVKLVAHDEKTRIGRFGGEGTGGQAFYDFDWSIDSTYRFLVTAQEAGDRTNFTGYLFLDDTKTWKRLVTFSRVGGWQPLRGYYSFVEDFRRNRRSAQEARVAEFGGGWIRSTDGDWKRIDQARFTADSNPAKNIDAEVVGPRFSLATGGHTPEGVNKLRQQFTAERKDTAPPTDLPV